MQSVKNMRTKLCFVNTQWSLYLQNSHKNNLPNTHTPHAHIYVCLSFSLLPGCLAGWSLLGCCDESKPRLLPPVDCSKEGFVGSGKSCILLAVKLICLVLGPGDTEMSAWALHFDGLDFLLQIRCQGPVSTAIQEDGDNSFVELEFGREADIVVPPDFAEIWKSWPLACATLVLTSTDGLFSFVRVEPRYLKA